VAKLEIPIIFLERRIVIAFLSVKSAAKRKPIIFGKVANVQTAGIQGMRGILLVSLIHLVKRPAPHAGKKKKTIPGENPWDRSGLLNAKPASKTGLLLLALTREIVMSI